MGSSFCGDWRIIVVFGIAMPRVCGLHMGPSVGIEGESGGGTV
jgi:hypothetical protein